MSIAPDLFPTESLLDWLPGETLFSLLSRQHQLSGFSVAARSSERFFGAPRAGAQHDFPNRLSSLVYRTNGHLGSIEEIAANRTLLAFYRAFIPTEELTYAIACMAGNSVAHLKFRLGILTSRFRAHHPLKACPICMEEDIFKMGWAYWHIEHQYPGVWACSKHSQLLIASTLKATGVQRFDWSLPHLDELSNESVFKAAEMPKERLLKLARLIDFLVKTGAKKPFLMSELYVLYRERLALRGWITKSDSLRMNEISKDFLQYVEPLRQVNEFQGLPQNAKEAFAMLGRILRPPRAGTHPLRHIVMIDWLFADESNFYEAVSNTGGNKAAGIPEVPVVQSEDARRSELHRLMTEEKLSARAAAQVLKVDTQTVLLWARQMGVKTSSRSKKLSITLRAKVVAALREGIEKKEVGKQTGLSESSINRVLLADHDLHHAWLAARTNQVRQNSRNAWLAVLETGQENGVKWMRTLEPKVYAWLYRNDRIWLDAHKPGSTRSKATRKKSGVDWILRDIELSAEVRIVALRLLEENQANYLFLWQIYQKIPELKAKISVLNRLPLTRLSLEKVLKLKKTIKN